MNDRLVDQPSALPTRKVSASTAAAALAGLVVSLLNRLAHAGITVEEAGFLTLILVFLAGYVVRERDHPDASGT